MRFNVSKRIMWPGIVVFVLILGLGGGIGIGYTLNSSSGTTSLTPKNTRKAIEYLYGADKMPIQSSSIPTLENLTNSFVVGLVTDGSGKINDKSFNQSTMQGLLKIYGLDSIDEKLYRVPSSENETDIVASYTDIYGNFDNVNNKKKVIIAPGFGHPAAIRRFWQDNQTGYDDLYFLLLDQEAGDLKNTIAMSYDVSESGFFTGFLSALFLEKIGDETPKVGLWGGGPFDGVFSFMKGFVSGIKYYNESGLVKYGMRKKIEIVQFNVDDDYTNSTFDSGKGRQKADYLISNGADIILPVAGTQTEDLIAAISASNRKNEVKIIGVDVDQSVTYSENSNLFLSSITKNLSKSSYEGYKKIQNDNSDSIPQGDISRNTFLGNRANGYSDYIKQFDTSSTKEVNKIWKTIYDQVDGATPNILNTWADALDYIKS